MHNYALREYWDPVVHSPSTVKKYFHRHKTILQKENIPSLLTTQYLFTVFFCINFLYLSGD
jgi:hypothetical protein